ncbi:MAG: HAD family hydrolase [Prevotella sp.]|jgi:FMN phosphatase YigB (HAD superfamily)
MIKTVIFDLGGVIITIDQKQAVSHFEEIGVTDASKLLDPYRQAGFFGDLEEGKITDEEFRSLLSKHVGHELSWDQCAYGWQGYVKEVPRRNLDYLLHLREQGYRVVLLSNTNPYMMDWARSNRFSGDGHPLDFYLDKLYLSYQVRLMKPNSQFFWHVMQQEKVLPEESLFIDDGPRNCAAASQLGINTLCVINGDDWTSEVTDYLNKKK